MATIEVEDVIRELKKISGFDSYLILNHDGNLNYFHFYLNIFTNELRLMIS